MVDRPPMTDALSTYEQLLSQDLGWAMTEGSIFFEGRGAVQETLRKIARRLDEIGVPYALAGGMALFAHQFRRFTEDVDILVTADGLTRLHEELDGRGYVRPFASSKNLRDTETKVKIEFLITGQYPGDGKPKAIAFPDPSQVAEERAGIKVLNLPTLISLKIASGLSGVERSKDLSDVVELIKTLQLPVELAGSLDGYARPKYLEIWHALRTSQRRFVRAVPIAARMSAASSLQEVVAASSPPDPLLAAMLADGVILDPDRGITDGYVYVMTTDSAVAAKYDMEDEREIMPDGGAIDAS